MAFHENLHIMKYYINIYYCIEIVLTVLNDIVHIYEYIQFFVLQFVKLTSFNYVFICILTIRKKYI